MLNLNNKLFNAKINLRSAIYMYSQPYNKEILERKRKYYEARIKKLQSEKKKQKELFIKYLEPICKLHKEHGYLIFTNYTFGSAHIILKKETEFGEIYCSNNLKFIKGKSLNTDYGYFQNIDDPNLGLVLPLSKLKLTKSEIENFALMRKGSKKMFFALLKSKIEIVKQKPYKVVIK